MKSKDIFKWVIGIAILVFVFFFGKELLKIVKNIMAGIGLGSSTEEDSQGDNMQHLMNKLRQQYPDEISKDEDMYQHIVDETYNAGKGVLDNKPEDFLTPIKDLNDKELEYIYYKFGIKQQALFGLNIGSGTLFEYYKGKLSDFSWFGSAGITDLQQLRIRWNKVPLKF